MYKIPFSLITFKFIKKKLRLWIPRGRTFEELENMINAATPYQLFLICTKCILIWHGNTHNIALIITLHASSHFQTYFDFDWVVLEAISMLWHMSSDIMSRFQVPVRRDDSSEVVWVYRRLWIMWIMAATNVAYWSTGGPDRSSCQRNSHWEFVCK